ncbi:unnamed protein product [Ilex paraguariensis]|uniref:1-acylglycerol-3-phosphate O-acyltransferase n=1 Tax=Ilex paraguariensis TaxID=185542 RepID=A0ABC8SJW5_9AQUA
MAKWLDSRVLLNSGGKCTAVGASSLSNLALLAVCGASMFRLACRGEQCLSEDSPLEHASVLAFLRLEMNILYQWLQLHSYGHNVMSHECALETIVLVVDCSEYPVPWCGLKPWGSSRKIYADCFLESPSVINLYNVPDGGLVHLGHVIQVYTDSETFRLLGTEHALVICNHRSDIDWLVGWVLAQRSGCLGSALAVMKKSSKLLPVIGWSMWFSEYLFLERSWAKDEGTLKSGFQQLRDFPQPFWLALFVEGTRFTQAKLLAAQEYAASTGLHVPRNILIPRTKGFVTAVSHMRSFVPAIYDMTVAIPKSSPAPTMLRLFKGQPSVMHVHIKRHSMMDLPETDDAVAQWCRDVFVAKDKLLDKHLAEDTFGDQQLQDTGRPVKSLLVIISWACLLIFGALKFLQWSSLLSSWKGVIFSAIGLGIVTFLMHILVQFTQSERSTPAKVVPANGRGTSGIGQDKHQ